MEEGAWYKLAQEEYPDVPRRYIVDMKNSKQKRDRCPCCKRERELHRKLNNAKAKKPRTKK
jgi:hypothetical protein